MNEWRKAPPNYTLVTWDADDWAWFNTHTLRRLRLRPPVPGEPCLRDYPDAEERVEAARQCGFVVAILVMRQGLDRFAREPGTFLADIQMDSFTDAGMERLIEAPAAAYSEAPEAVQ